MDIPFKRALVKARLKSIEESRARFKEAGEVDNYIKGEVSGGLLK